MQTFAYAAFVWRIPMKFSLLTDPQSVTVMFTNNGGGGNSSSEPSNKKLRLSNGSSVSMMTGGGRNTMMMTTGRFTNSNNLNAKTELPIFAVRWRILQEIRKYNSVIVIGETGSGKTTQIPQYLFAASMQRLGIIGITQPRRVAAVTIATRVAKEMNSKLGETVGYSVRFEDVTTVNTKIKYLTDGMLLREAISDPMLRKYTVIILDEAHERTLHTDVLFGVVKKAQSERREKHSNPLKVIIMSATMDVDHFSHYFNKAPVLYLEGRQFPVQVTIDKRHFIMYAKEQQEDYLFAALVTIFQIHQSAPPRQDILVFLTGQEEIESLAKTARDIAKSLPNDCPQLKVCPLYAALPSNVQLNVFNATPKGCRKVILSTNLAETSVTIQGIKFVIDAGMVKASSKDLESASMATKRKSRQRIEVVATSTHLVQLRENLIWWCPPGVCYRAYTEAEFESMRDFSTPEIQRSNLSGVVLQMMAIGIDNVAEFDFMDKPSTENIVGAYEILELLGAIEKQLKFQLTPIGRQMSLFPLDPRFAKVLLASKELNCTDEILSVIALLSVESVIFTPQSKRDEALAVRRKFISSEGDHLTLLSIYKSFRGANTNKHWCQENYVHHRNLQMAGNVRNQLLEVCAKLGIVSSSCGLNLDTVRKCLVSGLFMNSAELQGNGNYLTFESRQPVFIHPSSCLFNTKPAYVIFTELVQTTKCYMRNVSVVDPHWLMESAPLFFKKGKFGF